MKSAIPPLVALLALILTARGATVTANFTSASIVPVTAASYTATGNDLDMSLSFAPSTGTNLTVVRNTGTGFINGRFSNLAHGQKVSLTYRSAVLEFVANYYGGTGNDLVLQWAGNRAYGWGSNQYGQLGGDSDLTTITVPSAVLNSGVLAGKSIASLANGGSHTLCVCSDGTLAAWGNNSSSQLGNGGTTSSSVPIAIHSYGALAGKTVVAVAAGNEHSLALCADGTLAAWGGNGNGQLGNNTYSASIVPIAINSFGALSGKTVVAVAAGYAGSLALCSDGRVVAWGSNGNGQLGDGTGAIGKVPVAVSTTGAFSGKTVTAIAAGGTHNLALCSDGTLITWGNNSNGQIGNNTTSISNIPVAVNSYGILAGKSIAAIAGGGSHSLALCSDGTLAAWGDNGFGQLGINTFTRSTIPAAVTSNGALAGKTAIAVSAGYYNSLATCTDGTVVTWGVNSSAQLGNNSDTNSPVPVPVYMSYFGAGEKCTALATGPAANHVTVLAAIPSPSGNSSLSALAISEGTLSPVFSSGTTSYSACVTSATTSLTVTPTASNAAAGITVNGAAVASGLASQVIALAPGNNDVTVVVTALDGTSTSYAINVLRPAPIDVNFTSASMVAVSFPAYDATGNTVNVTLGFAPPAGTNLTIVGNTGSGFINGRFTNLAQGQTVTLTYNGFTYTFIANYYGGTGNDLVLQWASGKACAWGNNAKGQLGNNSVANANLPAAVLGTGVLAGKTVTAVAVGESHSLALCADGTLAAWGDNTYGQLGNGSGGTNVFSQVPVAVTSSGVLSGKTVVAIAAGGSFCLVLCSDGTLAAWGYNGYGQLGNSATIVGGSSSKVPVAVVTSGVLAGRSVTAIAAGANHGMALCADGRIAAWGLNYTGQLGNNSIVASGVPVAVDTSGFLAGRNVTAIAAGSTFSLALCSDGTVGAWGSNGLGQLGTNDTADRRVPTAVNTTNLLRGKIVSAIAAGDSHCLALCTDGTFAAWGGNDFGKLGNNGASSNVPVAVTTSGVLAGKTITGIAACVSHSLALCSDGTLAAWGQNYYGQLGSGGNIDSLVPAAVSTASLASGEKFAFLARGAMANQTLALTAAPLASGLSGLNALTISSGTLSPAFSTGRTSYTTSVPNATASISVTPTAINASATITVNGTTVVSGNASTAILLAVGTNTITINITSPDGTSSGSYTISVTRGAIINATFTSATTVPVTAAAYTATASVVNLALGYAPATGTTLTVLKNTGPAFISGRFSNLAQFQIVTLTYNNATYKFIANYYGGSGNDLVLQWANDKAYNWGSNFRGQLGNNSLTNSSLPVFVGGSGVLAGKTVVSFTAGSSHCLALCLDGTIAAWGYNSSGQLGNDSNTDSLVPVAVDTTGVLAGKTVIAISAGGSHSLALCTDGTVAAWGGNSSGQLGNGDNFASSIPVSVATNGALAGKTVTAIAAGSAHSIALCSDGTIYTWGVGNNGQLGNGGTSSSNLPVAVTTSGALAGKTVTGIASGSLHALALCADGTLVTWGYNSNGQLGNNTTTNSSVPVAINAFGAIAGRSITAIAGGTYHSVALRSDGTVVTWGYNNYGQLGNNSTTSSSIPVTVVTTGVLSGRTVTAIAAGDSHCLALCSDGSLASWGRNLSGELGDNTTANKSVPATVSTSTLGAGEKFMAASPDISAFHTTALTAVPLPTLSVLTLSSGTLSPTFSPSAVGYTASVANTITALTVTPSTTDGAATIKVNGSTVTSGSASASIPLAVGANTISVLITAQNGTATTYTVTVTRAASAVSTLSALAINTGSISPAFVSGTLAYTATVPAGTASVTVTPTLTDGNASVKVNGTTVVSGSPSAAVAVSTVPVTITVLVTAQNGVASTGYTVTVNNIAPSFSGYAVNTPYQTAVAVSLSKILTKAADGNGDPLAVIAAGPSANAGAVALQAASVSYTPPAGFSGTDTFPVTIRDSRGATVSGAVTVTVGAPSSSPTGGTGSNPPVLTALPDGKKEIAFQGIPGRTYQIQRSIGDLDHWTTLSSVVAGPAGKVSFIDDAPPPGSAFYRLALP